MEQVSKTSKGPFWGKGTGNRLLQHPHLLADQLPNTVLSGVLQGLYLPLSCVCSQAAPRASGMMNSQTPPQHPGMQW